MSDRLSPAVRDLIVQEIASASGREVSFVGELDRDGVVVAARVVARGTVDRVLALPGAARTGEMLLHNHPSGNLSPSGADLMVAAQLHDNGVGFAIVSNDATRCYVVVEVPRARTETRLDTLDVVATLGEHGPIAEAMGTWEDRQSQRDMCAHVADGYNDGGVLLLEAGTGVGKSFAYLVPALAWARANGERTVVSTNTINLQEQLVGKDLPFLRDALATAEHTPSFALLKGWRNYLCLARLHQAVGAQRTLLEPDKHDELTTLASWAGRTSDGSLSDLAAHPSAEVWDEVSAESDLCPRLQCEHYDRCFFFRARRQAAQADIVVANHHLLAADLSVRQASDNWEEAAVLPPYQRLVLDEAHHLEDVAAGHLGSQVSSRTVRRLLGRFERNGRGLAPTLLHELRSIDDLLARASLDLIRERLLPALRDARLASEALFARLHALLAEVPGGQRRLDQDFANDPVWADGLTGELDGVLRSFAVLRDSVEVIAGRLEQAEVSERRLRLLQELKAVQARLDTVSDGLVLTLQAGEKTRAGRAGEESRAGKADEGHVDLVRWIQRSGRRGAEVTLAAVPIDLAPVLRGLLFDKVKTVVLTSATLAAGGDFGFIEGRLGLGGGDSPVTVREAFPSPFDYPSQCLFGIPNDLPDPWDDEAGHASATLTALIDLANAADGGMFALFTSHAALQRAASSLRHAIGNRWPLLVQGEASRDQLLRRFRELGNAILLGTDSFWEGVDVPGRALRALVLCKLPFKVPSEPLTSARLERLAEQGEDGFMHYLLPHAALKLKQGFGRLIRSQRDVGVVVLLDSRVVSKRYGALVLSGLPRAERHVAPWAQVRLRCEDFFARHGIGATV